MASVSQSFSAQVGDSQRLVIYNGQALSEGNSAGVVMIAISSEFGDTISVWDQSEQNLATVPVHSSAVLACNRNDTISLGGPTAGQSGRLTRGGYLKGVYQVTWDTTER